MALHAQRQPDCRLSSARSVVLLVLAIGAAAPPAPAQTTAGADATRGRQLFEQRCALCHASDSGGGQGPGLSGIVGRKAAGADFPYTQALRASGLTWTAAQLDRYLASPASAVPGTSMPIAVPDATERRDIIAYLATLHGSPPRQVPASVSGSTSVANRAPSSQSPDRQSVYADWRADAPGVRRHITPADMPTPFRTASARNTPRVVARPAAAVLRVPEGFTVRQFADGLDSPRVIRTAPNGDLFVAESRAGRVRLLRAGEVPEGPPEMHVFAEGLDQPFGIAFYPRGTDPQWVYVATNNSVVRFPYRNGDTQARGPAQVVVAQLTDTSGGHSTRDIAFSPDGQRMFVSVGSASNVAEGEPAKSPEEIRQWEATHGLGAAWGTETHRAAVLVYDPAGRGGRLFATGIRNCVGLAIAPRSGDLWCATNERDALGDDLVPDYATRVREGAFYGWPWYYIGSNEDPRHRAARPDLAGRVTTPDVLLQPHSAPLAMTFYDNVSGAAAFPADYRGDALVALHGSWNRTARTGYKVVRVRLRNGVPTGEYEDFLTGFVVDDDRVWGRPVGVTVARDGALIVSEDGNGTLWRIAAAAAPEQNSAVTRTTGQDARLAGAHDAPQDRLQQSRLQR